MPSIFSRYSMMELALIAGAVVLGGAGLLYLALRVRPSVTLGLVLASSFVQGFAPIGYISLALIGWLAIGVGVIIRFGRIYWDRWALLIAVLAAWYCAAALWSPAIGSVVHAVASLGAVVSIYLLARACLHEDRTIRAPLLIASPFLIAQSVLVLGFRFVPDWERAYLASPIALFFSEPGVEGIFGPIPQNVLDVDKAGGVLLSANTASLFVALGGLLLLREAVISRSWFFGATSALAFLSVIGTGSRSPFAVILLIGMLIAWCLLANRSLLLRLGVLVGVGILAVVGAMLLTALAPDASASLRMTIDDRIVLWTMAGAVISIGPILGLGFGGWADYISRAFYDYFPAERPFQEFPPHNLFLQAWVDAGVVAVILLVVIVTIPVVQSAGALTGAVRGHSTTTLRVSYAIVVAGTTWPVLHGLFDTTTFFGDNHALPFYSVFAALSSLPGQGLPQPRSRGESRPVQVTFVLPGLPRRPGGGHKVVYQYANGLASRGQQVTILHLRPQWKQDQAQTPLHRWMVRLYYATHRASRPKWFALARSVTVRNAAVQTDLVVGATDVLIATSVRTAHFVYRNAERLSAVPVYFIQHYEDYSDSAEFVDETWRLPMRRIVVSGWLKSLADERGLSSVIIRNGIDADEFPPGPPLSERPLRVLGLASEQPWKRTDLFVEVAGLLRQHDARIEVHAFGQSARPDSMPADIRYSENPSPRELARLYQEARVYICTSDYEGFGLPVAEAMSSGTATVSTLNGGVDDFAQEYTLYAPAGDAQGLAAQVMRLLDDETYAQQFATRGLAHARDNSLDRSTNAFADFVTGLATDRRSVKAGEPD